MKLGLRSVFLLFIFFILSCKKDKKDTESPVISFSSPTSGQTYNMFDSVRVTAHVSDNMHLSYINVTLTDGNHNAVQSSYSIPITSTNFIFDIKYILTNYHLPSGIYYIQVTADVCYNTTSSYQSIYITDSPT